MSTSKPKSDDREIDLATREGREAAGEPYPSALIPIKYHRKPELADAWTRGFMDCVRP